MLVAFGGVHASGLAAFEAVLGRSLDEQALRYF